MDIEYGVHKEEKKHLAFIQRYKLSKNMLFGAVADTVVKIRVTFW